MLPPPDVRRAVEATLSSDGHAVHITDARRLGGGCISPAVRLAFDSHAPVFLKWTESGATPDDFFVRESESLAALGATGRVRVPRVVAVAERWLLLEWLEPARASSDAWARLGADLAALHRAQTLSGAAGSPGPAGDPGSGRRFGWHVDNYIGSLPQANERLAEWPEFWRERRLRPQLERALAAGHLGGRDRASCADLFDALTSLLEGPAVQDGPSLVHGDLWSGNVHFAESGAALIDPASYYGHREVDLAMAELFGGFDTAFFDAYRETWPLQLGYAPGRRAVYQLYYLLVHVNLFGAGYVSATRRAVATALDTARC